MWLFNLFKSNKRTIKKIKYKDINSFESLITYIDQKFKYKDRTKAINLAVWLNCDGLQLKYIKQAIYAYKIINRVAKLAPNNDTKQSFIDQLPNMVHQIVINKYNDIVELNKYK